MVFKTVQQIITHFHLNECAWYHRSCIQWLITTFNYSTSDKYTKGSFNTKFTVIRFHIVHSTTRVHIIGYPLLEKSNAVNYNRLNVSIITDKKMATKLLQCTWIHSLSGTYAGMLYIQEYVENHPCWNNTEHRISACNCVTSITSFSNKNSNCKYMPFSV